MKKKLTTALLLIAVVFMASCGSKTSENAMYQCPMKCEGKKMYDKSGQCPVCKMDLEEVEANHEHHEHDSTHTKH